MPQFAVECEDGRVFQVEAATAEEAVDSVALARNLRRASLRALPPPRREREFAMPLFWAVFGLVAAYVLWAIVS